MRHPVSWIPSSIYLAAGVIGTVMAAYNSRERFRELQAVRNEHLNGPVVVWTLAALRQCIVRLGPFLAFLALGAVSLYMLLAHITQPPGWLADLFTVCLVYPLYCLMLNEALDSSVPERMRIARDLEERAKAKPKAKRKR